MDDIRDEARFVAMNAGIAAAGIGGVYVTEKSLWWLVFIFMIAYGLIALFMYLIRTHQQVAAQESQEEARNAPAVFIQETPNRLVRNLE